MGIYRLLLAAAVMLGHLSFYPNALPYMLPGAVAVEAFYIVSGFLITLVLTEKYDGRLFLFYSNRALRIYPIYWVCLALYVIANFLVVRGWLAVTPYPGSADLPSQSALWWSDQHPLGAAERLGMGLVNIFIVGQDLVRAFGEPTSNLYYHYFVYVRVAWTVAVELSFYAVAPFVVRRLPVAIAVLMASFFAQRWMLRHGTWNPYDYQLFPFEAWLFMAGALSYRLFAILRRFPSRLVLAYSITATLAVFALTATYNACSTSPLFYLVAVALCLPGAAILGRRNPIDSACGDLSYPLYLIHPLGELMPLSGRWAQPLAIGIILVVTVLIVRFVERPIEKFRRRRAAHTTLPITPSPERPMADQSRRSLSHPRAVEDAVAPCRQPSEGAYLSGG